MSGTERTTSSRDVLIERSALLYYRRCRGVEINHHCNRGCDSSVTGSDILASGYHCGGWPKYSIV
jgi:hypothetical protein